MRFGSNMEDEGHDPHPDPLPHLTSPTLRAGEELDSLSHEDHVGEGWGEGRVYNKKGLRYPRFNSYSNRI